MNYPKTFDEYMAQKNRQAAGNTPAASGGFSYPATFDEYMQQKGQNRQNPMQTAERERCVSASGFDRMQTDMGALFGTMDGYFTQKHRGVGSEGYKLRVREMLKNVENERDYFDRYAQVMGEDAQKYQAKINEWEKQLKRYQNALSGNETDEDSLALGSGLVRFRTAANDYFTKASETEAGTAAANKAMQWASGAKKLLEEADEVESYLKKKNTAEAQSLLQQVQQYKTQLAQMQETGTGAQAMNPLTGKPMGAAINPNLPRYTEGGGITAGSPYRLGQAQEEAQNAELAKLMGRKAQKADWQNQTVQQHMEYIVNDLNRAASRISNKTTTGMAKGIYAPIFEEIAERLNYIAMSGKYTEEEYEWLVDGVERTKKQFLKSIKADTSRLPGDPAGNPYLTLEKAAEAIPDKGDAMKEFRYQKSNLTRENIRYKPVDELLDRMHFTYGEGNWGNSAAERAAITFMGQEVLPEYLANAEMTQEQYDRFMQQIKGTPNEAQLRKEREANGLKANPDGQQAALDKYKEIDGQTYLDMLETGSRNAADNVMLKYPGGMDQVLTRGLGYVTKAAGKALNMFGENPVGNWFEEGGQQGIDYENKDWQEGKQREYEQGRYASELLQNGSKFEKWTAGMTKDLTQAALEMAAAGAIAGQISAGNTALAQLSSGGKYASSLANAQKAVDGYTKFAGQMANLMRNSSNLIISANAALNNYAEAEDAGLGAPERAVKLIAGGLIEYGTNGLFGGNPVVDPEGAGAVAKYIYKLTDNETIRKIVSSKVFDRIGEGMEEVASAVAGAALDYALTGESSLSAEELVNEFTVGVLLSMVMSAPEDIVDLTARAKNFVKTHTVTRFGKTAQSNLEVLYGTMANYTAEYLAGDENMMRFAGWSEKEIKRAKAEWQTITREFNTLADKLEKNQSVSSEFLRYKAPEGFFDNDFVDADFQNTIRANQTSEAALLTDRALDIRIITEREMINSLRGSDAAQDVYMAQDAQNRLDILEAEKGRRAAERAQNAAERSAWENTQAKTQTAEQTQQEAQERTSEAEAPAEMTKETVQEAAAEEINQNVQQAEGGMNNEQPESDGKNQEWNDRMDPEGQAGGLGESGSRSTGDGGGTGENESLDGTVSRKTKLDERVEQFKGIAQDTPMNKLVPDADPQGVVGVVPVRKYTKEMQRAQRKAKENGVKTTFIVGTLAVKDKDGEYRNVDAVYMEDEGRIIVSVSSAEYEPETLVEHEMFHSKISRKKIDLADAAEAAFSDVTNEEWERITNQYLEAYRGVYGDDMEAICEEILADAAAGMNRFREKAFQKVREATRKFVSEVESREPAAEISDATRRTQDSDGNEKAARRGGTRASMAGKKAKTANSKTLALAEAMEEDGASREEIWRKTGWIRGADGQWRFEVDDSKAEFRPNGDARLMGEPRYRRLEELTDKWGDSFEKGGEPLTEAEEAEMEALQEEYSDRVWEKKYELQDFLKHDELYEAYPMLRHTTLRFEKLDPGVKGKFDKRNGSIILSDSLFGKGPETLLHEIQHIIQKYEGFQGGTSPEYWARRDYESGDRLQERLQQEYDYILNGLTKEEQNDYIRYQEIDGELERLFYSEKPGDTEKYDRMDAEHDRLYEKLYQNEWFGKLLDLKRQMENPGEIYLGQYINSAGEIEARETASRRKMTAEERQNKMPDLGWDRALMTESSVQYSTEDVLTHYGIESINDYIGVQKAVLNKLVEEGFFTDGSNVSVNQESGMVVVITKRGIRETLGNKNRFETLPRKVKLLKLATIEKLPELIQSATLRADEALNYHNPKSKIKYAYLDSKAKIGEDEYTVEITVRKSEEKNKFWIHKIQLEMKKEESGLSHSYDSNTYQRQRYNKTRIPENNVAHDEEIVKGKIKFSLSPTEKAQRAQERAETAIAKAEEAKQAAQESYKRELTGGLKKLFEVQSYDNEALEKLLETPMAEMQQGVKLLNSEKDDLFEALMDLGTATLPADDYYQEIREELKGRKIFVPEGIREEFGDDWNAFRKKAFGMRIYLTNEAKDRGADVHMMELAEMYPDMFTEEYDATEMLRQIVGAAEKGKDARMSLRKGMEENEKRFGLKREEQLEYQRQEFEKLLNRYEKQAGAEARETLERAQTDERLESLIREADGERPAKKPEGIVEPWTISEEAAQKRGFPVLNGRQVYPLRTWVKAADMGNYGLVLDKSAKKGMLTVLFTNKETGLASVKDMDAKLLTAVDPVYQPGTRETASLLASMPPEKLEDAADAEDLAEFYNWYDAQTAEADARQKAETRAAAEEERKASIVRTAEEYEQKKQERLEGVQKAYLESFGTSEPDFPYGKGKPMHSRGTSLQPGEALALLQAMTGKKWELTNRANGTWKATITKEDAPKSSISPKAALEKLQASKKTFADLTAAGIHPEGTPKERFKGSPALEKAGVKIDGGIAEYSQVDAMRKGAETRRSIQRQIEKTTRKWEATKPEIRAAKKIASGRMEYYRLPDKCRPEVVSQLAALYLNERMTGEDLIRIRKGEIRDGLLYKMIDLFPTEKEIQADPSLFKPEKLLVMNYRTALRSMVNIFGEERGMEIYNYLFAPVIRNTAESYRWMNGQFDDVRKFTDSKGKKSELNQTERAYVHMMLDVEGYVQQAQDSDRKKDLISAAENVARGESVENEAIEFALNSEEAKIVEKYAQWINGKDAEGIDKVKCENAMKEYREKFDLYFEAINDFLVAHGMQPIGKIKGYTPHIPIAEKFNLMSKALEVLGLNETVTTLPAEISGRTEGFRPQKRWNPFFLERKGDKTAYDIEEAFQNYVQYLGDILYHTDDIQKIRAAENYLRQGLRGSFVTSLEKALDMSRSGNVEEKVEYLQEMGRIGNDMREYSNAELAEAFDKLIEEMLGEAQNNTRYSDLVVWLKNYGDILAGKQFGGDRGTEYGGGREWLNIGNKLVGAFAKANVAGNLSSVLNQSAQLAMLQATRSQRAILKATQEFCTGKLGEFRKEIDFLTGKKGIDYLVQSGTDKFISGMFAPAEFMDSMLSTIATRAAYWDAIRNGKNHEEAMRFADWYGRALMADRTKGAKPLKFHSKGVVVQMLNVFQIEPLNTVEFVMQDMPLEIRREAEKNGKKSAARMLLRTIFAYLIAAFVLNRLTDELYGGTPAPLDIAGLTANFFASGKGLSTNDYMRKLINKVVGSEIFDVPEERETFDTLAAIKDTGYNLINEIPFASNVSGLFGVGDRTMPFPNIFGTGKNLYGALFPPKDSKTGERPKVNGQEVLEKGLEFLAEFVPGGRQAKKTGYGIKAIAQGGKTKGYGEKQRLQYPLDMDDPMTYIRTALFGVNASPEAKAYYAGDNSGLTAKQTQLWNELREEGADGYALYGLMMRMDDAMNYSDIPAPRDDESEEEKTKRLQMKEEHRKKARAELAAQEDLTDGQRMRIYSAMVESGKDDEIDKLMDAGMKWKDISEILDKRGELKAGKTESEWAAEFASWLDGKKYAGKQREVINEALVPQSASFYNKMTAAGVGKNSAIKIEGIARKAAKADGKNFSEAYQARAVAQAGLSENEAYKALCAIYSDGTAEKFKEAHEAGIPAKEYTRFWLAQSELESDRDEDGEFISGSKREKVIELIDSLNLTAEQKDWIMSQKYKSYDWWMMPWS
nr:MAG TPA: Large polyvalent protein associated domain 23 [Bacteriophage sp.]